MLRCGRTFRRCVGGGAAIDGGGLLLRDIAVGLHPALLKINRCVLAIRSCRLLFFRKVGCRQRSAI